MVRKSLQEWHEETQVGRVLARQPAARALVDALLDGTEIDVPDTVPVAVTAIEYDVWIAATAAQSDADADELVPLLIEEFGSEEAAMDALSVYAAIKERLRRARQATGKPARLEPPPKPTPEADRELLARLRPQPPRMTRLDIFRYSGQRAVALGFSPADVWAKEQGRRKSAELKAARAQIVLELRERNASMPDIGAVFGGRTKESIFALVQRAQANRTKGDDDAR